MSKISNTPKRNNFIIKAVRGTLEHRATWLYLILKEVEKKLFTRPAQMVFEMKISKSTDNELVVDFGHCPLVAAWQKLGCSDEEIARLCDIAMEGDKSVHFAHAHNSAGEVPKPFIIIAI